MDPSVTKVSHMLKVLRLVGPWLTWRDWRILEKLKNEAIREWCHSDDAATSLFGLWQEHTESLVEIAHHLWDLKEWSYRPPNHYSNNQIPTFVGLFVNNSTDGGNVVHLDPTVRFAMYRSSLELSNLEQKIAGNAIHEGSSCVKNDHLPMRGGDRWLHITTTSGPKWEDSIPPYYYLKRAAPNGLKIVLDVGQELGWMRKTIEAVGRAAALGLSGLIVYGSQSVLSQVLEYLVSALQDQMEGEFSSPLEFLAFHPLPLKNEYTDVGYERAKCALRDQFALRKLRNLKYLNMSAYGPGYFNSEYNSEDIDLEHLPYACPNLQVLDMGDYYQRHNRGIFSAYRYPLSLRWPDDAYGPHNLVLLEGIDPFLKWKTCPSVTGILLTSHDHEREDIITSLRNGLFPSLKVLLCDLCVRGETYSRLFSANEHGLLDALAIGCPNLRFLQIFLEDLYTCGAACHGLLKKLLILVVICDKLEPIIEKRFFPENCEMRVLTIHCFGIYNIRLCLEGFMNIVDECLPKLEKLNVIYSIREQSFPKWLKDQFTLKSIDLCIYHRKFPYFKEEEGMAVYSFDAAFLNGYEDEFDGGFMLA